MLKVFLAEDELVVREGLRDMIPWEQYGFSFAGEASDGGAVVALVEVEACLVAFADVDKVADAVLGDFHKLRGLFAGQHARGFRQTFVLARLGV